MRQHCTAAGRQAGRRLQASVPAFACKSLVIDKLLPMLTATDHSIFAGDTYCMGANFVTYVKKEGKPIGEAVELIEVGCWFWWWFGSYSFRRQACGY